MRIVSSGRVRDGTRLGAGLGWVSCWVSWTVGSMRTVPLISSAQKCFRLHNQFTAADAVGPPLWPRGPAMPPCRLGCLDEWRSNMSINKLGWPSRDANGRAYHDLAVLVRTDPG